MTDDRAESFVTDEPAWPQRTIIFMVVGACAALAVQQLIDPDDWLRYHGALPAWRTACATGIAVGALAFGFGLSRVRPVWAAVFGPALGLLAGLIVWWNGNPDGVWGWSGASLFLAVAIALPLFQVARDEGRATFPYTLVHGHAWTNVVLWGACWVFTGIVVALSHLLAELFALIGINVLREILNKSWSNAVVIGLAFGAALGLLRDRDRVVGLLQRVVTSVLSVLAPVLGIALVLFIVSLPFTGLNSLWQATKSTTPILMACIIGALILANAVIGNNAEDEAKSPVLRWSAVALGVAILPLAVIAALAMGLRLNQYGMTPDRLWGLICVVFAVGYGVVYFVSVVRRRDAWGALIRRDNIRLAFATMAVALVLATPLVGFNAISVNDQVARLKSGRTPVDKFDWAALGFDFGEPGKRALDALEQSADQGIAKRAGEVRQTGNRYEIASQDAARRDLAALENSLRTLPLPVALPAGLRSAVAGDDGCAGGANSLCVVVYRSGAEEAWVVQGGCFTIPVIVKPGKQARDAGAPPSIVNSTCSPQRYVMKRDSWTKAEPAYTRSADLVTARTRKAALDAGKVEVRTVPRRQLFIGDEPVGEPFE